MKKEEKDLAIVAVFLVVVTIFSVLLCIAMYYNKIEKVKMDISDFEIVENDDIAIIENITTDEKYVKIYGKYLPPIKSYKIYFQIENDNGDKSIYKTQLNNQEGKFYSVIRRKDVTGGASINIIYMCDNNKKIIKTDKVVGEKDDK